MKYEIGVIGDCVQDMFILAKSKLVSDGKAKRISYAYGDKINVDELHYDLGGSACNAAVAIRNLGIKTTMISMLGDDIYSRGVIEQLKAKKVGTTFLVKEVGKDLGLSFILLGPDRDRTILTYRADNDFSKIKFQKLFRNCHSFYLGGINIYSGLVQKEVLDYVLKTKKKIYINPSIFQIEKDLTILKRILKRIKIASMNVEEAQKILGFKRKKDIKELLTGIKKLGAETIVITNGPKGAYAYDGKKFYKVGIYPLKRIDSTGGGDSFCATFVATQIKGYNIEESLKLAAINSGNVVSVYGAQRGLLGEREIIKRLRENKVKLTRL